MYIPHCVSGNDTYVYAWIHVFYTCTCMCICWKLLGSLMYLFGVALQPKSIAGNRMGVADCKG